MALMDLESNTSVIALFTGYGLTIATCVALIARTVQGAYYNLPIAHRTRSHLPVRRKDILTSGALALVSFTLNAYHIIDSLVSSYGVWSLQKKYALPTNIWTAAAWYVLRVSMTTTILQLTLDAIGSRVCFRARTS